VSTSPVKKNREKNSNFLIKRGNGLKNHWLLGSKSSSCVGGKYKYIAINGLLSTSFNTEGQMLRGNVVTKKRKMEKIPSVGQGGTDDRLERKRGKR